MQDCSHCSKNFQPGQFGNRLICFDDKAWVSNLDQFLFGVGAIMAGERTPR